MARQASRVRPPDTPPAEQPENPDAARFVPTGVRFGLFAILESETQGTVMIPYPTLKNIMKAAASMEENAELKGFLGEIDENAPQIAQPG